METIHIIIIVAAATAYIGWSLWRRVTGRAGCGCGCDTGSTDCADKCSQENPHSEQERE